MIHYLEVRNGGIFLDDKEVRGVTDFKLEKSATDGYAMLSLKMLVKSTLDQYKKKVISKMEKIKITDRTFGGIGQIHKKIEQINYLAKEIAVEIMLESETYKEAYENVDNLSEAGEGLKKEISEVITNYALKEKPTL